jgi:hypothetical protein
MNENQVTLPPWLQVEFFRIKFLENEIRIAEEIHAKDPLKKDEGARWASACKDKIAQIKLYIDRRTNSSLN